MIAEKYWPVMSYGQSHEMWRVSWYKDDHFLAQGLDPSFGRAVCLPALEAIEVNNDEST